MSAQALLSITPLVLPAAAQATADVDASGFKGMLGDVMEGADAPGDALKAARPDQTIKTALPQTDGIAAAGFLIAPASAMTPVPTMTPVPASTGASSASDDTPGALAAAGDALAAAGDALAAGDAPAAGATPAPPPALEPAAAPSSKDAVTTDKSGSAETAAPAKAFGETPTPTPTLPQTATSAPAREVSAGQAATKAAAALVLAAAASKAQAPSAQPAVLAATAAPPAAQTVPVAPPPLRALAERTSSPLDSGAKTSASAEPAKPAVATPAVAASTSASDQPVKGLEAAAAPQRDGVTADAGSDDPASPVPGPGPAPAESATAQARAVAHETAPPQISRASLEATAQIAAQIVRKLEGRSTRFEMALTPDDLGRIDVKLDIDADGRLAARLAFDNPLAATDLKGRADELRRQLQEAGFQLADNALEFADRDSSSSAFDRGGDARKGQNRAFAAASRLNAEIDVAQPPRWMALSLSPSGLDLKV